MSSLKKCLVWDLDNTLWDGVLLEGNVRLREEAANTVAELDRRGILHSIASRGDEELAMAALREYRLDGLFLLPQINWSAKSQNILTISKKLQISLDTIAFIDDDPFEREQVAYMLPAVLTLPSEKAAELPRLADFSPGEITTEAQQRRWLYQAEIRRDQAERVMALQSASLAGGYLLLAAHAEGLGACWMCGPLFAPQVVRDALDLPADWEPQALIVLGWPAERPEARKRRPFEDTVSWR